MITAGDLGDCIAILVKYFTCLYAVLLRSKYVFSSISVSTDLLLVYLVILNIITTSSLRTMNLYTKLLLNHNIEVNKAVTAIMQNFKIQLVIIKCVTIYVHYSSKLIKNNNNSIRLSSLRVYRILYRISTLDDLES